MYNVNIDEINEYAMELFHNGFTCSETVMYTLNKFLNLGIDERYISMSSGFPWGLGGGGCLCGALAGASMIISYLYGRKSFDNTRDDICFEINEKLHNEFIKYNGATCCRILMKGLDRNDKKRKENCSNYVLNTLKITINILNEYNKN